MNRLKRTALIISAFIIATSLFTACSSNSSTPSKSSEAALSGSTADTQKSDVLAAYKKVSLGMTKEQVDKALGLEAKEETSEYATKGTFNYVDTNTGYGVSVIYNSSNAAFAKTVIYGSHKDIAPLCKKTVKEDQKNKLTKGMDYKEVINILGGEGVEVNVTADKNSGTVIGLIRRWANSDGSGFQICFSADDKVNDVSYFNRE